MAAAVSATLPHRRCPPKEDGAAELSGVRSPVGWRRKRPRAESCSRVAKLDFTQNLKEATDAITWGLRHLRLASEGFSLSAANADVQELPAILCD